MGYTITFRCGVGVVSDENGNVITLTPLSNQEMYEFDIRHMFGSKPYVQTAMLGSASMPDGDAWHLRLGHRNIRDIRDAFHLNLISGIPLEMSNTKVENCLCDSCARGKSTKYIRRATVKQTHLHQRGQTIKLAKF